MIYIVLILLSILYLSDFIGIFTTTRNYADRVKAQTASAPDIRLLLTSDHKAHPDTPGRKIVAVQD